MTGMTETTILCECRKCGHSWRVTRTEMNASAGAWLACPVCQPDRALPDRKTDDASTNRSERTP